MEPVNAQFRQESTLFPDFWSLARVFRVPGGVFFGLPGGFLDFLTPGARTVVPRNPGSHSGFQKPSHGDPNYEQKQFCKNRSRAGPGLSWHIVKGGHRCCQRDVPSFLTKMLTSRKGRYSFTCSAGYCTKQSHRSHILIRHNPIDHTYSSGHCKFLLLLSRVSCQQNVKIILILSSCECGTAHATCRK